MKFKARIGEQEHEFEVIRQGATLRVRIDDAEPVQLEIVEQRGNRIAMRVDGRLMHAAVHKSGTQRQIWSDGRIVSYERVEKRAGQAAADSGSLSSTIPAVVSQVLVEEGQQVAPGDKLILLESMKMVIPIVASKAGVVGAIHCAEGDAVQPGVALIDIED